MNDKKYESLINFRRKDAGKLSYAIRQFNKKINSLEGLEREFAPNLLDYYEVKENIKTRREFNRVLRSLKRYTRGGQEEIVKLESGENISKWEKRELEKAIGRASNSLYIELNKEYGKRAGTQFGMKTERISQIESTIKAISNIDKIVGRSFKKLKERVFKLGVSDKSLKRAETFKENYLKGLKDKQFKTFENYDIFMKYINTNLKNPMKFYDTIQKSEIMSDFFLWYDSENGVITYGGFVTNEDTFNTGLREIGILK